jgi:hypothetical protein
MTTRCGRVVAALDVTEGDAAFGQVVGREFQRDLVTRQDADVVLLHLAGGVGDQLVPVLQGDAKTRVRQDFVHDTIHLDQFFFGHGLLGFSGLMAYALASDFSALSTFSPNTVACLNSNELEFKRAPMTGSEEPYIRKVTAKCSTVPLLRPPPRPVGVENAPVHDAGQGHQSSFASTACDGKGPSGKALRSMIT